MKRSAIVLLGLTIGFAVLAKVPGEGDTGDDAVMAEQFETQRQSESVELVDTDWTDWEQVARVIEPDMSHYIEWQLASQPTQDEAGIPDTPDADPDSVTIYYPNASGKGNNGVMDWTPAQLNSVSDKWNNFDPVIVLDRFPSWGGAIILEYRGDAGGIRSEGLIWSQQGWADLIDR